MGNQGPGGTQNISDEGGRAIFTKKNRCFICHKIGHFARNYPQSRKFVKLLQEIEDYTSIHLGKEEDLEFIFSMDDEPTEETLFSLDIYEDHGDDHYQISEPAAKAQEEINAITIIPQVELMINAITIIPQVELKVYSSKWDKPTRVIAFIDTGAACLLMNPIVLPEDQWVPHFKDFNTASNGILTTTIITKHLVKIGFFPGLKYRTKLIGSDAPGKDLIVGFDIFRQLKDQLHIRANGITFKKQFKPYSEIPRLFQITNDEQIKETEQNLIEHSCAESHKDFMKKGKSPLWMNEEFFIKPPFKKNESINPTKASHSGMNPDHLQLAKKECEELLEFDLIEPSDSKWACEAFYFNKRAEQTRGKLRLVINYQPLNHFLQDDKFPIPNKLTLSSHLAEAKYFSKFDLKSGFWQLGIHPEERPKTGFCIPDHHFQWKVMPFRLKTTRSLFQKAMIKIFQPIFHTTLVYIDDILLFSDTLEEHVNLLCQFEALVTQYGIMLSAKKMVLAQKEIDFLGMHVVQGAYSPGPHICQELLKFPDTSLTTKQIQ
ncbi:PREDICTED: uncharacterized protein LOC109229941 [Nicotiana attenuata]|uniref:uncharacterized protein LOC109229941 n=1 Tax=Nicotiana attenuata TaxID=49451 RepID=UPI0009055B37|nr:PREDICTED: uncharacterized protein LOC109229941 [Nicotiana attenuata]